MSVERRNFPQFFITAPQPCPYLPGQMERKVFTHLTGHDPRALVSQLTQAGFRRSQNIAYRPGCDRCTACSSVRIPVGGFHLSRGFRRIMKRNADMVSSVVQPQATQEHYELFRTYVDTRHADGGMADMTVLDFAAMIDETMVDTRLVEYRYGPGHASAGQLAAVVLVDLLQDGLSLIYSFYDTSEPGRSFGSFVILDSIERVKRVGLGYLYLGYYVKGARKMEYKARFTPQERLGPQGWTLTAKP